MHDGTRIDRPRWLFALAVLAAATIGAGSKHAAPGSTQAAGGPHSLLRPMIAASNCSTDTTLCLGAGRFRVEATWTKPGAESGAGHARC